MPLVWVCVGIFVVHLLVDLSLTPQQALLPSGILLLLENLMAAIACLRRARHSVSTAKLLWNLLGCAELIHFAAGLETGVEMVFLHLPHYVTTPSDFLIFMWGAPLMLAFGSPTESSPSRIFYWLDGVQIALMMVMAFVAVFGALPFQHVAFPVLSGLTTVWVYAIENGVVALVAGLRLSTRLPGREQRFFFASIFIVLALYAVLGPTYNFQNALSSQPPIRLQYMLSIHQLLLVVLATHPTQWPGRKERSTAHKTLALVLDNGSPIVFPVIVVFTATALLGSHIRIGAAAILCSLFTYGARSTIVQLQLQTVQARMIHAQKKLERMSLMDPLTDVPNRRTFDQALKEAWETCVTFGEPFALLLIDVDHFKILNDTRGHSEGDRCLRTVAKALQSVLSGTDQLARIGGEEFAAILHNSKAPHATLVAEDMMEKIAALGLPNVTPIGNTVTVSIGLTDSFTAESTESMFARADEALYCAKREGRNRTISLTA